METLTWTRTLVVLALLPAALAAQADRTTAVVQKIDRPGARVTLKHGPLNQLGVPAMTMALATRDPALLDRVAVGDKVQVEIEKIDGRYTVVSMRRVE